MRLSFIAGLLLCIGARARAQTTETPVPFDSAQRVTVVTPPLVDRLKLTAPTWPVQGDFREARLYAVQPAGGFVMVVQRPSGALERYALSEAQRTVLRGAIDAAMLASGRPTGETSADVLSEPAGNAFARHQTLLAAGIYGPLAASLVDDGSAAGAIYLIVTGGTFFATYGSVQSQRITRAQNHLAGHLGVAAASAGWLLGFSATGNSDKGVRALALGSAVVGTVAGINLGRTLTDAEAHAATGGVESSALVTLALTQMAGLDDRASTALVAGGILAGYPIGLSYPRSVGYTVTAGDVDAMGSAGLIGVLYGASLLGRDPGQKPAAAILGATYVAGLVLGDRFITRPYDLTQSQSNIAGVGALAGALVGLAIPTLAGSDEPSFTFGATAVGATLGMAAILGSYAHRAGDAPSHTSMRLTPASKFSVDFGPAAVLGALSRVPGRYSLVHVGF